MPYAEIVQNLQAPSAGLFRRSSHVSGTKGHILQKGGTKKLILGVLKKKPHPIAKAPPLRGCPHGNSFEKNLPFHRHEQSHENPEKRGFAGSVGSPESDLLSFLNEKGHLFEKRLLFGISEGKRANFEKGFQAKKHPPQKKSSTAKRKNIPRESAGEASRGGKDPWNPRRRRASWTLQERS